MKIAILSALRTYHLHPKEIHMVLIHVRGRAFQRDIVRPERLIS